MSVAVLPDADTPLTALTEALIRSALSAETTFKTCDLTKSKVNLLVYDLVV